jgi:hypothetical protein
VKPWLVVGGLVAALALYGLGRREARLSREAATWRQNAEQALAAVQGYERSLDSLRGVETKLRILSGRTRLRVDTLRLQAETLLVHGDTQAAIAPLRESLSACRQGWAVADAAGQACDQRAALAEARATRLDSLLRIGVRVHTCRLVGLLPCPSRGLAFLGGAIGGYLLARR